MPDELTLEMRKSLLVTALEQNGCCLDLAPKDADLEFAIQRIDKFFQYHIDPSMELEDLFFFEQILSGNGEFQQYVEDCNNFLIALDKLTLFKGIPIEDKKAVVYDFLKRSQEAKEKLKGVDAKNIYQ